MVLIPVALASSVSCSSGEGWQDLEPQVQTIHPRIAFRDTTGREIGPEELSTFTGRIRWFIEDMDSVPKEAIELHSRARDLGTSTANYTEVLRILWQAHQICPGWLYPVYDAAWTYFLKGDAKTAERLYAWVDRMEPRGYWVTKEALDCLRKERVGEFPRGAYKEYTSLEWLDESVRRAKLEKLVKRAPTLAPAWKDLAVLRQDPPGRMKAVEAGVASTPDQETRGFLLIHKATLLVRLGSRAEADSIYNSIISDPNSTMQTRALAQMSLAAK